MRADVVVRHSRGLCAVLAQQHRFSGNAGHIIGSPRGLNRSVIGRVFGQGGLVLVTMRGGVV